MNLNKNDNIHISNYSKNNEDKLVNTNKKK